jgi:hypothetical protein
MSLIWAAKKVLGVGMPCVVEEEGKSFDLFAP